MKKSTTPFIPFPYRYEREIKILMVKYKKVLTPRLLKLLELRLGLKGEKKHTYKEIGQYFGVTPERIRQMQSKATELLFMAMQEDKINFKEL